MDVEKAFIYWIKRCSCHEFNHNRLPFTLHCDTNAKGQRCRCWVLLALSLYFRKQFRVLSGKVLRKHFTNPYVCEYWRLNMMEEFGNKNKHNKVNVWRCQNTSNIGLKDDMDRSVRIGWWNSKRRNVLFRTFYSERWRFIEFHEFWDINFPVDFCFLRRNLSVSSFTGTRNSATRVTY